MRPPPRRTRAYGLALVLQGTCALFACDLERAPVHERAPELTIHVDERPVLVGVIDERLDAAPYLYLRLDLLDDSGNTEGSEPGPRWVALPKDTHASAAAQPGAVLRVRSLGRRHGVWVPELEAQFDALEYVALLPQPASEPGPESPGP
ncbi:hypothetical protein PPSIR1_21839 [Plesiocystis pacifica SIR-1]|uniref:DUF3221 domain-containing protein n=1 Tax=Plesiocystis pacifica SIR-1 TaxID=391625 RepID=A6FXL5_9BACT|nr:hypothetical protein [Plesiocystis pacifica]EDM81603.1 hypothetical protein PPSIR1_21839 [Plesiocystis pacifica SIR-1]